MNKLLKDYIFPLLNILYKRVPGLYSRLYFLYKEISEYNNIKFLKSYLQHGFVVIDVGANVGDYSKVCSNLVGRNGRVFAFEPDIDNFKLLTRNLSNTKNTQLYNLAVGEKNTIIKMFRSEKLNTDHQTYDTGEGRASVKVKMVKLDNFFDNKFKVNLINLDIQGYDYFALKGMQNIIKRSRNLIILGEIWPYGLVKSGSSPIKYVKLLKKLNLTVIGSKLDLKMLNSRTKDQYYYTDFIATKL